jgi:hypothetical protein
MLYADPSTCHWSSDVGSAEPVDRVVVAHKGEVAEVEVALA